MKFPRTMLEQVITVGGLISFHYFEYAKGFVFEGEEHDFWEFLYVDKGEVEVRADDRLLDMKQGEIIFHKPHEFHTVRVREHHTPPNLIVISFECASPAMSAFAERRFALDGRERNLLSLLMQEGFQAFEPPWGDPSYHRLERRADAPFGSEQLVNAYLEILLISLARRASAPAADGVKISHVRKEKSDEQHAEQIIEYMRSHLSDPLSLDDLGRALHLGKSRLKEIMHAHTGMGVMEYFKSLRIEQAKTMIRESQCTYTEIAEKLGYSGIHYFSRDFRKKTGMSPSEYAKTVQARMRL
ncbi:AraC family transcriptional regulator [Paenibacillus sp.]|uniref:AraC family transcriptional regulator n=1 Tax=Paenibacillus sp. TaxID=58172 RepID=UPI002D5E119C|nr:AraC family transcriptional regulator [Paenibacillus sp.]HZG83639.1 AraC family transcriptional regulator [Paenibacillus sp.]